MGAKKRPFYRIVVADARSPRDGRFIETLGYYDPLTEPKTVKVNVEKYHQWIRWGAQPSDSVQGVLKRSRSLEAVAPAAPEPALPTPEPAAAVSEPVAEAPEPSAEPAAL